MGKYNELQCKEVKKLLKILVPNVVAIIAGFLIIVQTEAVVDVTSQSTSEGNAASSGSTDGEHVFRSSEAVSSTSQPSDPVVDYGFFPEWVELVKGVQNDSMLEMDVIVQKKSLTSQEIQGISPVLPIDSPLRFNLTHDMLQKLQEAGTNNDVLEKLKELEDQEFSGEGVFWKAVIEVFKGEDPNPYREVILTAAAVENRPFSTGQIEQQHWDYHSLVWQESLESWEMVFYSRLVRDAFESKRKQEREHQKSYQLEKKQNIITRIFWYFGLPPKPTVMVILIGIGLYLVLELLNRIARRKRLF